MCVCVCVCVCGGGGGGGVYNACMLSVKLKEHCESVPKIEAREQKKRSDCFFSTHSAV